MYVAHFYDTLISLKHVTKVHLYIWEQNQILGFDNCEDLECGVWILTACGGVVEL